MKMSLTTKIRLFLGLLCTALICLTMIAVSTAATKIRTVSVTPADNIHSIPAEPAQNGYLIREYNGIIGVFKNGEPVPFETYDIPVRNFPAEDILQLTGGIFAHDNEELELFLENYLS
jgi:hypothetical protein